MKLIEHKKTCTKCEKEYPISNFYFKKKSENTHSSQCKQCEDPAKAKRLLQYRQTEKGHIGELYSGIKKRCARDKKELGIKSPEELMFCWEKQKKKFGLYCPVTNVKMTMKKGLGNNKQCPTNISPDRLDNDKGYTKENIRFVTANFNTRKGAITMEEMERCLELSFKKTRQA